MVRGSPPTRIITNRKESTLKPVKFGNAQYESGTKLAVRLLKTTKKNLTEIAQRCDVTVVTVHLANKKYGIRPAKTYKARAK